MSKHTILSFRSMKPVARLMATFGLSPLSSYVQLYSSAGILKRLPERPSRISRMYGFILGSALTLFNLYNFIEAVSGSLDGYGEKVFFYMVVAVLFMFLMSPALAYAQSCSSRYSKTRRMLLKLEDADRILMKQINCFCGQNNNGKGAVKYRHGFIIVTFKIVVVIMSGTVMYIMDTYNFYHMHSRQLMARTFSHLVVTVTMIEFWGLVELLKDRFSAVNSLLEETLRERGISEARETSVHTRIPIGGIHKSDYHQRPPLSRLRVENVVTLRMVHYELHCIAKRYVVAMFSANLLVEVVQVFVSMILSTHTLVNNPYGTSFGISLGVWFTYTVLRLILVTFICDGLTAEARRTTEILARPVVLEDQAGDEDEALFRQIVLFSRQMADCGPLRFRVLGGIFIVEGQILVAIFGTTLTYLVVLQQLR